MEEYTNDYVTYLESLRIEYKINQEDFCDGICSTRNYRRYLSKDLKIPYNKIAQFCDKLSISPVDFYDSFFKNVDLEFQKLVNLYQYLIEDKIHEFNKAIKSFKPNRISSKQNLKLYNFCIEAAKYKSNRYSLDIVYKSISEVISYPECLKRKFFDFVDIITLELISEIEYKLDIKVALFKLKEILLNFNKMVIGYNSTFLLPSIYSNVALLLGKLDLLEESLDICNEGILYSQLYSNFSYIVMLRYYKFCGLKALEKTQEAEIEAAKCIAAAINSDNKNYIQHYHKLLKKDLGFEPVTLIEKHQKELLNLDK